MILSYLGKWLYYYGAVDDQGVKGAGDGVGSGISCLTNYPDNVVFDTLIDRNTSDSCNSTNSHTAGNSQLDPLNADVGITLYAERVCRYIVYFNHLFDIIGNISLSQNDSLGELNELSSTLTNLITTTSANYNYTALLSFYSQSSCTDYVKASTNNQLVIQGYLAALVENNFL